MKTLLALALVCLPALAAAQDPTVDRSAAFNVDRLVPTPGAGTFFQVEDGDVLPHFSTSFAVVTTILSRPLIVYSIADTPEHKKGDELSTPVSTRIGVDLLASVGLFGRFQLGLGMPLVVFQNGDRLMELELPDEEDNEPLASTTQGDLSLFGKVRFVEPEFGYGLAAGADLIVTLPTGDDEHFAGEAGVVVEARLIGSYRQRKWAAALNIGPRIREQEVMFLDPTLVHGNEIAWGLAGSAEVPGMEGKLWGLLELAGAWGVEAGDGREGPDPAEARGGIRYDVARGWGLGFAVGTGLGAQDAIGSPAWRGVVDVRYTPRTRVDSDRDGVGDLDDRCPSTPEDRDGTADADGCPDLDDDADGVADDIDHCPKSAEDLDKWQDADGCPEADNDEDTIADAADKCPNDAEDKDGHEDDDGCEDDDNDGDGVADRADACKDQPEDKDNFEDGDGCPDLDDDKDGIADAQDKCPAEIEDKDGWLDDDGCQDSDDDRDGVPDGIDKCPGQPETIVSAADANEADGCPDGNPIAKPRPDGTIFLSPTAALRFKAKDVTLLGTGPAVVRAVARAAHRAGWDEAKPALRITVWDDQGQWSDLARRRSEVLVELLRKEGIEAAVDEAPAGKGVRIVADPEALKIGAQIPIKQQNP